VDYQLEQQIGVLLVQSQVSQFIDDQQIDIIPFAKKIVQQIVHLRRPQLPD
jgi:hypothetical protein